MNINDYLGIAAFCLSVIILIIEIIERWPRRR